MTAKPPETRDETAWSETEKDMLTRTKKNIWKATTLTLAITALVVLGADMTRADTGPATDPDHVFPALYHENEDSCFVQVGAIGGEAAARPATARTALGLQPGEPAYASPGEYQSLAFDCGGDDEFMTVSRGAPLYAWRAQ